MTTKIKLKKSSVSSQAPGTSDLDYGEVAINYTDGRLYYKNSSNVIKNFIDSDLIKTRIEEAVTVAGGYGDGNVIALVDSAYVQQRQFLYNTSSFNADFALRTTDSLNEGSTNLYYTNSRADARIALQTGANLDLSSKSTTNLAEGSNLYYTSGRFDNDFSLKTTDSLLEGQDNLYYTDGRVASYLTTNSYATQTYVNNAILTKDNTDEITEGTTNLYYTTARADSAIDARVTSSFINALSGVDADTLGGQNPSYYLDYNNFTNTPAAASILDSENVRNIFSVTGNLTYDSATGQFGTTGLYTTSDFNTDFALRTTDSLTEGSTNLYYTDARFDTRLTTKTTTNLTEGTNLYYTTDRADSDAKNAISGSTGITYSNGVISTNDAQIVHDNLSGFVADEHVAHTSVTITAGNGLTGGGDISASRTLNVGAGTGVTVLADAVSIGQDVATTANVTFNSITTTGGTITDGYAVLNIAGTSTSQYSGGRLRLSNGATANNFGVAIESQVANADTTGSSYVINEVDSSGNYSKNIAQYNHATSTYAHNQYNYFNAGLGVTGNITVTGTVDGRDVATDGTKLDGIETGATADQTITAGSGLTGGGTGNVTLNVGAGTGVTVLADAVSIGQDVATTANVTFNSITTTDGLIVGGDLQVNGTTTTVYSENYSVGDNMIYMNAGESSGSPTLSVDVGWAANVNDNGSYEHVGMFRDATDDRFKVFKGYTPEPDDAVEINTGHASFALADFQAATFHGALSGNATTATTLQTPRTIALIGDVTATGVSFDGSGNISLTTAYTAGSIVNADINASAGIVDTKLATISTAGKVSNSATTATDANTASAIVARDPSGNFSAGTITAALSGNATTATTLETSRNFSLTGDVTAAAVGFNGSSAVALSTSINDASSTTRGLIKLEDDTVQSVAANAVSATASRTYGVQVNSSGQAVVNVPWTDTDTNTTYTGSKGITLSGTDFQITGNELASGVDLDTYRTTGIYPQNANADAAAGSNYPEPYAGILEVINDDWGNGLHTVQRYSRYNSTSVWTRYYYNGTWTSWRNISIVSSASLESSVQLIIYNSAGTAVKTLYGAGS